MCQCKIVHTQKDFRAFKGEELAGIFYAAKSVFLDAISKFAEYISTDPAD